jgi:F-type H+-transporting ATPase subunit epsilon
MKYFEVDILTNERVIGRNLPAESLLVPTCRGQINLLPDHTHMISKLDTGIMTIYGGAEYSDRYFMMTSGIIKVLNNKIIILSSTSEEHHEISLKRANEALKNAIEKFNGLQTTDQHIIEKYQRKIKRAQLRMQLAKYSKNNAK